MSLYRDQNRIYVFLCIVLLAVKMVADVIETRNVIPSFGIQNLNKKVLSFNNFILIYQSCKWAEILGPNQTRKCKPETELT